MYNNITKNLLMVVRNGSQLPSGSLAAGIWISNPLNTVERNSVSGSQGDGIVYYLESVTMGVGYQRAYCPEGMPLLSFNDNTAHSNGRYGLYINNYAPRTNPCGTGYDNSLSDPWAVNPPIKAAFRGIVSYANQIGLFADNIG